MMMAFLHYVKSRFKRQLLGFSLNSNSDKISPTHVLTLDYKSKVVEAVNSFFPIESPALSSHGRSLTNMS
jgi:hypothetical protein